MADGFIVPVHRPEPTPSVPFRGTWAVKYHHVDIRVRDQVAAVSIDQAFVNTSKGMMEVEYFFPVPPDAAIDSMTLMVDGKEFTARLLKAEEARKIYEDTVRRMKDPALLEYAGFGLFKTSAFPLQPGKPARVLVTYKNICRKDRDLVEVWYPLNTEKFSAKPLESVKVKVDIKSKADITAIYSPTHDLDVDRKDSRHVIATYEAEKALPITDFEVFYKAANEAVGATVMSHLPEEGKNGYFMLLVSPNPRTAKTQIVPKDVCIVFDHSGSMGGEKISQAKEAVNYILKNLNEKDRFCVIAYNDAVEPMFDRLVDAGEKTLAEALGRIDAVDATGGTNIHEALQAAMGILKTSREGEESTVSRPAYVIFLTDGQPTVGKTGEAEILSDTEKANTVKARIFTFGVGYEPNVRLLEKLARNNGGRSGYVRPKEPIETKVSSLYNKIKNPVMMALEVKVNKLKLSDMYPRELGDLFDGDQILLVGRYDCKDAASLPRTEEDVHRAQLVIKGVYEGKERAFEYNVSIRSAGKDSRYAFVEKLWAIRRVAYLLDEIQLHGKSQEVIDEIVRLSLKYGIMTPYTSFLADEKTELASGSDVRTRALEAAGELETEVSGVAGQFGAANREALAKMARPAPSSEAPAGGEGGWSYGHADKKSYDEGKDRNGVAGLRQFEEQATYRRGRLWIAANAANLDPEKDADKIKEIKRFSEEYFELVRQNTTGENQILASQQADEDLLIVLRSQAYVIR
jgi:Ca-activated chloride channel family protein